MPLDVPTTRREALARERAQSRRGRAGRGGPSASPALPSPTPALPTATPAPALPLASPAPATATPAPAAVAGPTRVRSSRVPRGRRLGVAAAMLFVGGTVVSTSVPANAYFVDTPSAAAQKFAVASGAGSVTITRAQAWHSTSTSDAGVTGRDGYTVTVPVEAAADGSVTVYGDPSSAVQWPFPPPVPISSGFGARQVANCSFCSTNHQGLDFTPGAGTPIHVVAAGVVSKVDQGSGALGYNVWVDHVIDGTPVTTVYAHMKAGSIAVQQGQKLTRGDVLGLVGSTGNSTGAHLHFEVHLAGTPVDPLPWLRSHAGAA